MTDQAESHRLTPQDPITAEELNRIRELEEAYKELGVTLLDLENERVRTVVASRRIYDEKQRLFEKILMDRGLAPNTPVEIDPATGQLIILRPRSAPAETPPT